MDQAVSEPRHSYPIAPGRRIVAHERSYQEVRELVLLLAEQSNGRDAAARLRKIVIHADHG
jgi:hypothetical protein